MRMNLVQRRRQSRGPGAITLPILVLMATLGCSESESGSTDLTTDGIEEVIEDTSEVQDSSSEDIPESAEDISQPSERKVHPNGYDQDHNS